MNNTFGKLYSITTFGESHGNCIGCVIDGCPSNLPIVDSDVQKDLSRRRPGSSAFVTQRQENDKVKILSGVFNNQSTGCPIALIIENFDCRSQDYKEISGVFRPGHADYSYEKKYSNRDFRGGGRSSARVTASIVAGGAIAKKWLRYNHRTKIKSFVSRVGSLGLPFTHWHYVNNNPLNAPTNQLIKAKHLIEDTASSGNSMSSRAIVSVSNVPVGLGEPVFNKLSSNLAFGVMGINAVKALEIGNDLLNSWGEGFNHSDPITKSGFISNNLGGIVGGVSTGQDIVMLISVKPTSSISLFKRSINKDTKDLFVRTKGRHDPCVGIRIAPILEAITAVVLMDLTLQFNAKLKYQEETISLCHPKSYLY